MRWQQVGHLAGPWLQGEAGFLTGPTGPPPTWLFCPNTPFSSPLTSSAHPQYPLAWPPPAPPCR